MANKRRIVLGDDSASIEQAALEGPAADGDVSFEGYEMTLDGATRSARDNSRVTLNGGGARLVDREMRPRVERVVVVNFFEGAFERQSARVLHEPIFGRSSIKRMGF
jgi:hypothetical protein